MSQSAAIPHHPLDALSGEELTRAVALLGHCANSLSLGCDCLGEIRYFDATLLSAVCSTTTGKLQYF